MQIIHKVTGIEIKDNKILLVRKKGKDIWTGLGGKPETGESEKETLLREIQEEVNCSANILEKIGDFEAPAAFDQGALLKLAVYTIKLNGVPKIIDDELEEFSFIGKDYKNKGIKLPDSIEFGVIPALKKKGLIKW